MKHEKTTFASYIIAQLKDGAGIGSNGRSSIAKAFKFNLNSISAKLLLVSIFFFAQEDFVMNGQAKRVLCVLSFTNRDCRNGHCMTSKHKQARRFVIRCLSPRGLETKFGRKNIFAYCRVERFLRGPNTKNFHCELLILLLINCSGKQFSNGNCGAFDN